MTRPTCASCDRPVADNATLCVQCIDDFEKDLGDVTALVDELNNTMSRQTSPGNGGGIEEQEDDHTLDRPDLGVHVQKSPFSLAASLAKRDLHAKLSTTVRLIDEGIGAPLVGPACQRCHHGSCERARLAVGLPGNDPVAMSRWLMHRPRLEHIRHHPAGAEIVDDLNRTMARAWAVVDLQAPRVMAGPCDGNGVVPGPVEPIGGPCGKDLMGAVGAAVVRCPKCRRAYDVEQRRTWLLAAAEGMLFHAEMIGRALPSWGVAVTPSMIRNYVARKLLLAHGVDQKGRPLYKIGEVMEVQHEAAKRQAERDARADENKRKREHSKGRAG